MYDLEYFELAADIVGLPEENLDDMDYQMLDEMLIDKFDIQFEQFIEITKTLLKYVTVAKSPLTGNVYKGFGKNGLWYLKTEKGL